MKTLEENRCERDIALQPTQSDKPEAVGVEMSNDPEVPHVDDKPSNPHTESAALVTKGLTDGIQNAVKDAVSWAGKKLENLGADRGEGLGPYESQATCVPSDLDPIGSGILSTIPPQKASETIGKKGRQEGKGDKKSGQTEVGKENTTRIEVAQ